MMRVPILTQAMQAMPDALHHVLEAAGPQAAHVEQLWNLMLVVCTVAMVLVLAAFLYALWRAPRADAGMAPDLSSLQRAEPGAQRSVVAALAVSVLLLMLLIVASFFTDRALAQLPLKDAVRIDVTGHQWWWEVRYQDDQASNIFTTANEIHIPVGKPVLLRLKADDVIHSFWVPNLAGKKDLIPGRTATLQFRADKAGLYRGQCAEFCGLQHAFMAFTVTARPQRDYDAWLAAQRRPAVQPATPQTVRGQQVFLSTTCAMCHAIQGTTASAMRAPDLTHIGSRKTLAAGTLPNNPDFLSAWITDPQRFKPGTNMPPTSLSPEDLQALVAYLGSLQ